MEMTGHRPAQIFASINTQPEASKQVRETVVKEDKLKHIEGNEIQVSTNGEMSLQPDRCKIAISVQSKKETAQDAKNSVSRRLDYILQTLNNHQIKVCSSRYFIGFYVDRLLYFGEIHLLGKFTKMRNEFCRNGE